MTDPAGRVADKLVVHGSLRWSARTSIPAAPNNSVMCCSARWGCRAARRPRRAPGQQGLRARGTRRRPSAAAKDLGLARNLELRSTYTDALPGFIYPQTHRVHTSYAFAATPTGRLRPPTPFCKTTRYAPRKAAKSDRLIS